jgi:hypothetical protein
MSEVRSLTAGNSYQDYKMLSSIQTTIRYLPLGIVGSKYLIHFLLILLTPQVCTTFGSGYLLSRVRGNYILLFGLGSACIANLLFAVPIPPSTNDFAYGFPAMSLMAFGADTCYPCLGLFTTQSLPREDQGVAGAIFQTFGAIGRAIFLPVSSAIQASAQSRKVRNGASESEAFLQGLRAVEWFCVGCMVASVLMTAIGLRNIGKIGLLKKLGTVQSGI